VIALVHGPDAALARAAVTDLARTHDPDGQATSRLDGRTASLSEVIAQAASPGFFGRGRVVIVDGLMARASKPGGGAEDDTDPTGGGALDLGPLFAATTPDNLLILVDPGLSSVPAAIRKVAPPDVRIVVGDPPRGAALVAWLQRQAATEGSALDAATARGLAERLYPLTWANRPNNPRFDVPPDLDRLGAEVAKLATAAHPGPIQRSHVDELVASGEEDQVFRFADAAARGALPEAVTELRKLLDAGEEPFAVIAQLYQQAELAAVLEVAAAGKDPQAVGRDLGLSNPGRMSAIAASRRAQVPGSASRAISAAIALDRQIKRGRLRDPLDALYGLVAMAAAANPSQSKRGGN
jgi:DNA polymerase-3 subunit delta